MSALRAASTMLSRSTRTPMAFASLAVTLMEPFSGSVSSLLDAQRLVAIPSTCQSTDFEGEIPRYIYLKYVVFQR